MVYPPAPGKRPVPQPGQHVEALGGPRHRLRDELPRDLGQGQPRRIRSAREPSKIRAPPLHHLLDRQRVAARA